MSEKLRCGSIVVSRAGHDRGDALIVLDITPEGFLYLSDGKNRPVEKPKKKKLIHVIVTRGYSEKVGRLIEKAELPDNALVMQELKEYKKINLKETGGC